MKQLGLGIVGGGIGGEGARLGGGMRLISENRTPQYYRSCNYGNRDSKMKHETADQPWHVIT